MVLIPEHIDVTKACPAVNAILSRIGDKWSVLIVMELAQSARRFNELKRDVTGISQRMLTLTLRGLERDGLVSRTVYDTVPPKVEYALTDLGRSLQEPVMALGSWAIFHRERIHAAQVAFDGRVRG
jgi:DNA-binding HxlR family transcriptional regulator